MKTQRELQLYYWGPHFDMVNEYNKKYGCDVKPYECMKYNGSISNRICDFSKDHNLYEFALTIIYDEKIKQHRPVFVGDRVYYNLLPLEVININTLKLGGVEFICIDWSNVLWNQPEPKRTFMLNEKELPCPSTYSNKIHNDYFLRVGHYFFEFDSIEDRNDVAVAIYDTLKEAKDKE